MPFLFAHVTSLLTILESLTKASPALTPAALQEKTKSHIISWFDFHRSSITRCPDTLTALFSFLLPEHRPDRVYRLREDGLAKLVSKCLFLSGTTRGKALEDWRESKEKDLGNVVQRIMARTEIGATDVTVEGVEKVLNTIAGMCRFSSANLRKSATDELNEKKLEAVLGPLWRRLSSEEGKWLVRAILKSHLPVIIPEQSTLASYHWLLPHLYSIQNDLQRICTLICTPTLRNMPHNPPHRDKAAYLTDVSKLIIPKLGVKIGRGEFIKAKGCAHAAKVADGRKMSVERKYDGEYCQIHIDLTKKIGEQIKIFSKSGRDSTRDRYRVHRTIREALKLNSPRERGFREMCIFEAELVVFNTNKGRIIEFYHLRSHINRAGIYIGSAADAPRDPASHLMLVLFDILLVDDNSLLSKPHSTRLTYTPQILPSPLPGRFELAERTEIDFSLPTALPELRAAFAKAIAKRHEGLVLKPSESTYLDPSVWKADKTGRGYGFIGGSGAWVKLKKDYIVGLGDMADLCVVGGRSDVGVVGSRGLPRDTLTEFHVACLLNKEEVRRFAARPVFKIIFEVSYSICKKDLEWLNVLAKTQSIPYEPNLEPPNYTFETSKNLTQPQHLYKTPLVFEITGGGFDKPTDCNYYTLRHPRVSKIHWDREFIEALSFEELQDLAKSVVADTLGDDDDGDGRGGGVGGGEGDKEEEEWLKRLVESDLGGKKKKKGEVVRETAESETDTDVERHTTSGTTTSSSSSGAEKPTTTATTIITIAAASKKRKKNQAVEKEFLPLPVVKKMKTSTTTTITTDTDTNTQKQPVAKGKENINNNDDDDGDGGVASVIRVLIVPEGLSDDVKKMFSYGASTTEDESSPDIPIKKTVVVEKPPPPPPVTKGKRGTTKQPAMKNGASVVVGVVTVPNNYNPTEEMKKAILLNCSASTTESGSSPDIPPGVLVEKDNNNNNGAAVEMLPPPPPPPVKGRGVTKGQAATENGGGVGLLEEMKRAILLNCNASTTESGSSPDISPGVLVGKDSNKKTAVGMLPPLVKEKKVTKEQVATKNGSEVDLLEAMKNAILLHCSASTTESGSSPDIPSGVKKTAVEGLPPPVNPIKKKRAIKDTVAGGVGGVGSGIKVISVPEGSTQAMKKMLLNASTTESGSSPDIPPAAKKKKNNPSSSSTAITREAPLQQKDNHQLLISPPLSPPPPPPQTKNLPPPPITDLENDNTSPVNGANVFLTPRLVHSLEIFEALSDHNAAIITPFDISPDSPFTISNATKGSKKIVFVESRDIKDTKRVVSALCALKDRQGGGGRGGGEEGEEGVVRWEVYDWRLCKNPKGGVKVDGKMVDWSLWHVWTV